MIRVIRWAETGCHAETVALDSLPASVKELPDDSVVWIDLEDPTPEEEARVLGQFLNVHPLTVEDVTKARRDPEGGPHFPKVEEFPDYLFVIVNPLPAVLRENPLRHSVKRLKKADLPQLSAVLTHTLLVTHHYTPMPCVTDGQAHLTRHPENLKRGPDYLFHLILDGIVDDYSPVVERIADELDRLEGQMFRRPTPKILARLLRIKRRVSYMRKTLILEREVLARLIRGEFHLVDPREIVYYRNVFDHLVRYTELIESAREMVSDLMQTHLSVESTRLNQVMKVLTMISTVVLPMSLIAGIYGMNFKRNMPELEWEYGYPFSLGLMVLTGVVAFTFFKWKKWI